MLSNFVKVQAKICHHCLQVDHYRYNANISCIYQHRYRWNLTVNFHLHLSWGYSVFCHISINHWLWDCCSSHMNCSRWRKDLGNLNFSTGLIYLIRKSNTMLQIHKKLNSPISSPSLKYNMKVYIHLFYNNWPSCLETWNQLWK